MTPDVKLYKIKVTTLDLKKCSSGEKLWNDKTKALNPVVLGLKRSTGVNWKGDPFTVNTVDGLLFTMATPGSMAIYLHDWILGLKVSPKTFEIVLPENLSVVKNKVFTNEL